MNNHWEEWAEDFELPEEEEDGPVEIDTEYTEEEWITKEPDGPSELYF